MSIASHSRGALRRTASSQRAAVVLNVVDKIVDQADTSGPPTLPNDPYFYDDIAVARGPKNPDCFGNFSDDGLSPRSISPTSESNAILQGRAPVPDGPIYAQLRDTSAIDGKAGVLDRDVPQEVRSFTPVSASSPRPTLSPRLDLDHTDMRLEEARTTNRLVHRALAAVQHQLRVVEQERNAERARAEQMRRERDLFRNIVMRFPFLAAMSGSSASASTSAP
mmetsp:Transcript_33076/g.68270  ORF Transcript_33076/g.68270 Transcript_33076/m.68270 type:complete len:222 (+) Transcript_33076:252-917(+)|eukprot:CAMPEP_0181323106 /NCGR_PEP_ID=MMETSP1101-20121128/19597_1 /TAXON_ID=46948 /ORGANISM="Rhodomonas abbreviata, Strain Caron Lab Isolate" /LENGTH=221 /DNA_ID=CAMNT_0023431089 /DNA_START=251 /DNA_END=916 /DNA_ORIENTATION=+